MSSCQQRCARTARSWAAVAIFVGGVAPAQAAILTVAQGGDLQAALNAAQPGDTILLQEGGATVAVAWTQAVVKTGACTTDAAGTCTVQSGTLSGLRPSVTLAVTGVTVSSATYAATANHSVTGTGSSITLTKPQ